MGCQEKFKQIRKNSDSGSNLNGYFIGRDTFLSQSVTTDLGDVNIFIQSLFLDPSPLVILNALAFIGFKVIAVAGNVQVGSVEDWCIRMMLLGSKPLFHHSTGRFETSSLTDCCKGRMKFINSKFLWIPDSVVF